MNLIYPNKIENIYRIFKENYNFDINDFYINIINVNKFDKLRKLLLIEENLLFNWSFFNDYIDKCDKCYNIRYKNIKLFVIMVGEIDEKLKITCVKVYIARI